MMGNSSRDTAYELAQKDPHLIRLAYWLVIHMGREELKKWEQDLELKWDEGGREAIMTTMEEEYLCDEEYQCKWHLTDRRDQCHWYCHWQEKAKITMIVDPHNYARPFVTMWTSKEQSHSSCPINMLTKEKNVYKEKVDQVHKTKLIGQMEEKGDVDDIKRTKYKHWEEHERGDKMAELFRWKLHNKQCLQTNNSVGQQETSRHTKKVTKKLDQKGNICQVPIDNEIRKILMTTGKSKSGRKHIHSHKDKNKFAKTTTDISGWPGPQNPVSEKPQKKKSQQKKNKKRFTAHEQQGKDKTNKGREPQPCKRVGREEVEKEKKEQQDLKENRNYENDTKHEHCPAEEIPGDKKNREQKFQEDKKSNKQINDNTCKVEQGMKNNGQSMLEIMGQNMPDKAAVQQTNLQFRYSDTGLLGGMQATKEVPKSKVSVSKPSPVKTRPDPYFPSRKFPIHCQHKQAVQASTTKLRKVRKLRKLPSTTIPAVSVRDAQKHLCQDNNFHRLAATSLFSSIQDHLNSHSPMPELLNLLQRLVRTNVVNLGNISMQCTKRKLADALHKEISSRPQTDHLSRFIRAQADNYRSHMSQYAQPDRSHHAGADTRLMCSVESYLRAAKGTLTREEKQFLLQQLATVDPTGYLNQLAYVKRKNDLDRYILTGHIPPQLSPRKNKMVVKRPGLLRRILNCIVPNCLQSNQHKTGLTAGQPGAKPVSLQLQKRLQTAAPATLRGILDMHNVEENNDNLLKERVLELPLSPTILSNLLFLGGEGSSSVKRTLDMDTERDNRGVQKKTDSEGLTSNMDIPSPISNKNACDNPVNQRTYDSVRQSDSLSRVESSQPVFNKQTDKIETFLEGIEVASTPFIELNLLSDQQLQIAARNLNITLSNKYIRERTKSAIQVCFYENLTKLVDPKVIAEKFLTPLGIKPHTGKQRHISQLTGHFKKGNKIQQESMITKLQGYLFPNQDSSVERTAADKSENEIPHQSAVQLSPELTPPPVSLSGNESGQSQLTSRIEVFLQEIRNPRTPFIQLNLLNDQQLRIAASRLNIPISKNHRPSRIKSAIQVCFFENLTRLVDAQDIAPEFLKTLNIKPRTEKKRHIGQLTGFFKLASSKEQESLIGWLQRHIFPAEAENLIPKKKDTHEQSSRGKDIPKTNYPDEEPVGDFLPEDKDFPENWLEEDNGAVGNSDIDMQGYFDKIMSDLNKKETTANEKIEKRTCVVAVPLKKRQQTEKGEPQTTRTHQEHHETLVRINTSNRKALYAKFPRTTADSVIVPPTLQPTVQTSTVVDNEEQPTEDSPSGQVDLLSQETGLINLDSDDAFKTHLGDSEDVCMEDLSQAAASMDLNADQEQMESSLEDKDPVLLAGIRIYTVLNELEYEVCNICCERWFDMGVGPRTGRCRRCTQSMGNQDKMLPMVWSFDNDMDPGPQPECLSVLTSVEVAAISRICPVQNIFKLQHGSVGQKGHSVAFHQDITEFARRLPRGQDELPYIFLKAPNQDIPLRANRTHMLDALNWLIKNNPYYEDVDIDMETLNTYPDDSNTSLSGVRFLDTVREVAENEIIQIISESQNCQEDREAGEPMDFDVDDIVPSAVATQMPQEGVRSFIQSAVLQTKSKEPTIPWPKRSAEAASEFQEGYFAMAHPNLFCHGRGDITTKNRRGKTPPFLQWLQHLLRYIDGRFARDFRFVLHSVTMHRRHQALTVANVYAKKCCEELTMDDVKERVSRNDDQMMKSLLHFGATIPGTRQYFKYESSKSISFERFVRYETDNEGMLNVFLTFSLPDLHMHELHRLLPGSERYLNKTVVKKSTDIPANANADNYITEQENYMLRSRNLRENAHITDYVGNKKLHMVISNVLMDVYGVTHWLLRNEFQSRGALHWHMAARMKGVCLEDMTAAFKRYSIDLGYTVQPTDMPDDEWEKVIEEYPAVSPDEEQSLLRSRENVIAFVTDHLGLTELHPQPDPNLWPGPEGSAVTAPTTNCLVEEFLKIIGNDEYMKEDYERLLNRVQRHKCQKTYCLRFQVLLEEYLCRFKFPKDAAGCQLLTVKTGPDTERLDQVVLETVLSDNGAFFETGILRMVRSHPRLVGHVPQLLSIWRGNCDQKLIESVKAVVKYILKYILKPESNSLSFEEIVRHLTEKAPTDSPVRKLFAKILLKTCAEHDISFNEAMKIASGKSYVEYSCPFKNIGLTTTRLLNVRASTGEKILTDNLADTYWARDTDPNYQELCELFDQPQDEWPYTLHPENISLYRFASHFSRKWKVEAIHSCPHPSPNFKYIPSLENVAYRSQWCEITLLLHLPGATPNNYLGNSATAEEALQVFVDSNQFCPASVKSDYLESLKQRAEPAEDDNVQKLVASQMSQVEDYQQDEVMQGLGTRILPTHLDDPEPVEDLSDFEEDDQIDTSNEGVDWSIDRVQLKLDKGQVGEGTDNWIDRMKVKSTLPEAVDGVIDPDMLNVEQRRVYKYVQDILAENEPSQRCIDLSGGAGTGKSFCIRACLQLAAQNSNSSESIIVAAPTGGAATLLPNGRTLHSLLKIPAEDTIWTFIQDLSGPALGDIQDRFVNARLLIIDEKGMVGQARLSQINRRLQQAKPTFSHLPFGGLSVILAGDWRQLPPVKDLPLHSQNKGSPPQMEGRILYELFNISIQLNEIHRQRGESNRQFRGELERLGTGEFTEADYDRWTTRDLATLSTEEKAHFQNYAVKLCSMKKDTRSFNITHLKALQQPCFKIKAINSKGAGTADSATAKGLPKELILCKNAKIILTVNLWTESRLVNGTKGTIKYVVFNENEAPPQHQPAFLLVEFEQYTGPSFLPDEPKLVALSAVTKTWIQKGSVLSRTMYPLMLGWAISIHKSQGMTIDWTILDLGPREYATGLTYTACTRGGGLDKMAFDPMPSFSRIRQIFKSKGFRERRKEEIRKTLMAKEQATAGETHGLHGQEIFPNQTCLSSDNDNRSSVTQDQDLFMHQISDNVTEKGSNKRSESFTPRKTIKIRRTHSHERRPIVEQGALFLYPGFKTNITIHQSDLNCIQDPSAWLNDRLADWYLSWLHTNVLPAEWRDSITIYNSMFFKRLPQVPSIIGVENEYEADNSLTEAQKQHRRVKNWAKHRHIWTKNWVLIPVCLNGHWVLGVITNPGVWDTPKLSSLCIFDSMGGRDQFIAKTIHDYFAEEWKSEYGTARGSFKVPIHFPQVPRQPNSVDCGIYLLHYAEKLFSRFEVFRLPDSFLGLQDWFPETEVMEKRQDIATLIIALAQEAKTNSDSVSVTDLPVHQSVSLSPELQHPMDAQIEEPAGSSTNVDRQTFLRQVILYGRSYSDYLEWISIAGFLEFLSQSQSSITTEDANFWVAKMIKEGQWVMLSDKDTCMFK